MNILVFPNKTGKQITATRHHITTSVHKGNFGDFKIQCHANNDFELFNKRICKYKLNLNKQINTFQLSHFSFGYTVGCRKYSSFLMRHSILMIK